MSWGTMLPTTETTPLPPTAKMGNVRLSSPLSTGQIGHGQDLRSLVHRAGRLLDHRDVGQLGHPGNRVGLDVLAGPAGDVVDAQRNVDRLGQGFEVLVESFLGRLVVIGGHDQGRVGPRPGRPFVIPALAVLLEPVPGITFARPAAASTTW